MHRLHAAPRWVSILSLLAAIGFAITAHWQAAGAATTQASVEFARNGALGWPASASVAHLKVKGTAMVATLAISSRTVAHSTRIFRSARSDGQI